MHHMLKGYLDFKYSLSVLCLVLALIKNTYCQKTCLNGGVLVSAPASGVDQVCVCNKNYVGTRCEITLSHLSQEEKNKLGCQLRPCWIGSTCEDRNDTFVCHCSANTFGDFCEQSSLKIDNPCSSKPCYNNGTCIQQDQNSYTCSCQGSYGGNSCKQNLYGACASNPCQRDGICVPIGLNDYSCQCPDWTIGKNCEVVFNPCSRVSCQNGGNCLKKRTLAFECNCTSDYTGTLCDQPRRESCLSNGCQNGQCKVNITGQYACSCNTPGYTGTYCEVQNCNPSCKYGTCNRNSEGGFYCQCQSNYNGNDCGSLVCFSGSTMVEHRDKGLMKISDLREGDYIKTYDETSREWIFSKFITYLHVNPRIMGHYIKLMTSGNKSLTISHYHYIAKTNEKGGKVEFVFAKDVKLNDWLITGEDGISSSPQLEYVTRIDQVYEEGAYAPLTESGTLAVNSIYASCYANAWDNSWIHFFFQPVIQASKYFTSVKFYDEVSTDVDDNSSSSSMFWYARFFFNLLPYIPFSSSLVYF